MTPTEPDSRVILIKSLCNELLPLAEAAIGYVQILSQDTKDRSEDFNEIVGKTFDSARTLQQFVKFGLRQQFVAPEAGPIEGSLAKLRHDVGSHFKQLAGYCQLLLRDEEELYFGAFSSDLLKVQDICETGAATLLRYQVSHDFSTNGDARQSSKNGRSHAGATPSYDGLAGVSHTPHTFLKPIPTPWWKRTLDIIGSGTGLLLLAPVFVLAAIAIKLDSRGPIFFCQMREGKDGKPFRILKFRSMFFGSEQQQADLRGQSEQDGPAFKLTNDPRITTVGKYLRKSCVDELPQLLNVLLGQMSLVGPRPLPIHESHACTAWQRTRLRVLPGLTCIWQVHGGREVKFAEWMRMDLEYIEKRSFWFDLKLIFQTVMVVLMHRGSV
jgi:lipopolysaccharide/colanic/teichoic acid biosynthesis glycosyltransferase